jgi:hypothetical protein
VRFFKRVAGLEDRVEGLELLLAQMLKGNARPPRHSTLPPGSCRPPKPVPSPVKPGGGSE